MLCASAVFRQGDKGDSWYIILKGSVNVIIRGKVGVATCHVTSCESHVTCRVWSARCMKEMSLESWLW